MLLAATPAGVYRAPRRPFDAVEQVLNTGAATALTVSTILVREREDIRETVGDELAALLLARVDQLPESEDAAALAKCFGIMAEVAPTRVLDAVPALAAAATSASPETRRWLVYTFTNIAEEYPEELLPTVQFLIDCIEDSDENLRTNTLSTLGKIAHAYPDAAGDIATSLRDVVTSDNALVRANAIGLLGDLAQSNPDAVIELAPELAAALTATDEDTRVNASLTLLRAGDANPEAVRAEHEQLTAALTDSHPTVRANCCTLIGNADAPVSRDQLRDLEDDPDERVREQAAWALDRLS